MIARLAFAYVRLLLALEILLFTASLLLHLSAILGFKKPCAAYGIILLIGTVIVGVPVTPFMKDGLEWKDQVKSCPEWMWKTAFTLAVYALLVACTQIIFPTGTSMADQTLAISGFPVGFDAIYICILYSVLWVRYLDKSEVIDRVRSSVILVIVGICAFLAHRAGYLRHPTIY